MKLRNLLFGTMIACAFASCSNEDDPISTGGLEDGSADAVLSIKFDGIQTKSIANVAGKDNAIESLTVVVFKGTAADETNQVEVVKKATPVDLTTNVVTQIPVKGGNKKVLVLANCNPAITATTTYTQVLALTQDYLATDGTVIEGNGSLSMNSKIYDVTIETGKENYLGYASVPAGVTNGVIVPSNYSATETVKLYRNVAKVALKSITVSSTGGDGKTTYANAKLDVKRVFILHAPATTSLVGADGAEWGATTTTGWLAGSKTGEYKGWADYLIKGNYKELFAYMASYTGKEGTATLGDAITKTLDSSNGPAIWNLVDSFYVYENTAKAYKTLLVVEGDFSYNKVGGGRLTQANRYYTVAIGAEGYTLPAPFNSLGRTGIDVLRNLQYNITLSITGPGYTTPFGPKPDPDPENPGDTDTHLNVKCEVVGFGQIAQAGAIE